MTDQKPPSGADAVASLLQNLGCLIMLVVALVFMAVSLWACMA